MSHRKKIKNLEDNILALACANSQAINDTCDNRDNKEKDYLAIELNKLQKKYRSLTGHKYTLSQQPQGKIYYHA